MSQQITFESIATAARKYAEQHMERYPITAGKFLHATRPADLELAFLAGVNYGADRCVGIAAKLERVEDGR